MDPSFIQVNLLQTSIRPRLRQFDFPRAQRQRTFPSTALRIISPGFWGASGPVDGIAAEPRYLDISVPPGVRKTLPVETSRNAFAYAFAGSGRFAN